jgi:hypothetical protein|tara:strand:+ start:47 stop:889 length:843 start_codon:yes stop_codon:yes gene_type:complete
MAKHLRTSGDYTIKTGTGAGGSNSVIFDSKTTRVKGDLIVDGSNTVIDTASLTIEDPIIILSRNNSAPSDVDSGILVNRGVANNAALYWNEGDDTFKAVTTTSDGTGTAITDTALAKIQVAEPAASSDAATKNYVDSVGGAVLTGSTNNQVTTVTGANAITGEANLTFDGTVLAVTGNITATTSIANDAIKIDDHTITTTRSNDDLVLKASGTGNVVIDDTLTFSAMATDPTATAQTVLYNKTAGGGGTGLYFRNTAIGSGAVGELISKKKATALAIALG